MSELILEVKGHYDSRYKTVFLGPIEDPNLSAKATGILMYLRTRPPGWEVRFKDLLNRFKDGEWSIRSGLNELEQVGYLHRERVREQTGKFTKVIYHVYEDPNRNPYFQKSLQNKDFSPQVDFQQVDNQQVDNRHPYQPTKVLSSNKQPTNQNQKVGWLSNSTQKESFHQLRRQGIKSKVAATLADQHDLETILDVIQSVNESGGVKNYPGLIIDRLNTIKETREKEREIELRREQAELQLQRQRELEHQRMVEQKDKELAEFHEWEKTHPGGSWSQFALATT